MKAEISKGVFKIKQFFPNSKITVVSGSDQNELRWLFKEKRIDHLFNNGIFGSPKNKIEILEEIFSGFKGEEKSIFPQPSLNTVNKLITCHIFYQSIYLNFFLMSIIHGQKITY